MPSDERAGNGSGNVECIHGCSRPHVWDVEMDGNVPVSWSSCPGPMPDDEQAGNVRYFDHPAYVFTGDAEGLVAFLGLKAGDALVATGETGVWFDANLIDSRPMLVGTGDGFVRLAQLPDATLT